MSRDELEAAIWRSLTRYKDLVKRDPSTRVDGALVTAILAAADRYAVAERGVTASRREAADAEMAAHPGRGRDLWKQRAEQRVTS